MKHLKEEQLIAYRYGDAEDRLAIEAHLHDCGECRKEYERLQSVLAALDAMAEPERDETYGRRVWQQIAPRLSARQQKWAWLGWMDSRRWAAAGAVAALAVAAFLTGRFWPPGPGPQTPGPSAEVVRERILLVAVGDHLDRSEMMLVELTNAMPSPAGARRVNISGEQRRAEDLLEENRLYRQTALHQGDAALADVLDDLGRVLLDIARSPKEMTPAQLERIRQRIEAHGILFKVRVVGSELRERQKKPNPPAQEDSKTKERNHT